MTRWQGAFVVSLPSVQLFRRDVILETWNETTKARRMLRGTTVTPAQIAR